MTDPRSSRRARLVTVTVGLAIVMLASIPPFVGESLRAVLMAAFSGVCHQLPDRSPHVAGVSLAVCFRCYGIYWGLPVAGLLYPALRTRLGRLDRRAPFVLAASLLPAGLDWTLEVTGLVSGSQTVRLMTGLIFGVTAGYYLASALARTPHHDTDVVA